MDSGNNSSGSIQSSSGGDIEEYDSRAESSSSVSLSAFLNNQVQPPPSSHDVGPFSSTTSNNLPNSHLLFLPPQQYRHNHMFEYPLSNHLDPIQRATPPPLPNLDAMWSKLPARSEPNQTDLSGLMPCSSSSSPQNQTNPFVATHHTLLPSESGLVSVSESAAANNTAATAANNNVVRNPKKRSRASRRAPTTVLTTDTANFRAMVQEFTGIPAPPFTSSPFPRTRLDLFASSPSSSTIRSTRLDPPLPPYLLRPFAQKLTHQQHLHPFPPSTTINSTQPLNNFHMHNPGLPFQAILQQPQKYRLGDSSVLASKTTHLPSSLEIPPSADNSHIKMGVFEELGLRHEHHDRTANCLHQNAVLSQSVGVGALSSGNNNNNLSSNVVASSSTEWAQRITGTITNNDCDHHGGGRGGGGGFSGTVNYNDVAERVTNGKVHYSASSSDFHGEKKGPAECTTVAAAAAARSQGMVESWIN